MKKIILLSTILVGSANAKIDYSLKYSLIENPFSLNDGYKGELSPNVIQAQNIAENTQALTIEIDYRPKKKLKVLGFKVIPKLKLDGDFYLNADFDKKSDQYKLLNRDDSHDKIRKAELKASLVAFRKLTKKSVLFLDLGSILNSSYNIEFDTATSVGRVYDYGLVSTSHRQYYFLGGYQAKLHKKLRVDASYKFSLFEYSDDYSIYSNVAGQTNDNLSHRFTLNTNLKFTKKLNLDFNTFVVYQEYQNKLAFRDNGYTQTTGLVEPQTIFDYSLKAKLNFKPTKSFRPYLSASYFQREDKVSGASDVKITTYDLGTSYKISKKIALTGSYSIKSVDYSSAIASLENENDTALLQKDVDSIKLGLKFNSFSFDYSNVSNDSTREYDNIKHSIYSLSFSSRF